MSKKNRTVLDNICAHCTLPMSLHEPYAQAFEFGACEKFVPALRAGVAPKGIPTQWNLPTLSS
jgi:hypothetical protein